MSFRLSSLLRVRTLQQDTAAARAGAAAVAARSASTSRYIESLALAGELEAHSGQAQAEWAAARRRTRPLEVLQDRHAEAAAAEDLRTEQVALDEHAGRSTTTPNDVPETDR